MIYRISYLKNTQNLVETIIATKNHISILEQPLYQFLSLKNARLIIIPLILIEFITCFMDTLYKSQINYRQSNIFLVQFCCKILIELYRCKQVQKFPN